MSSIAGTSKSKKGFRGFLRDTFGSSTSDVSSSTNVRPPTTTKTGKKSSTNPVWDGLRTSLVALKDGTNGLAHLSAAVGILLECFEGIEAAASNQQDYEDLARDFAALIESLKEYFKPTAPALLTKCISSVTIEMEEQAKEIEAKMKRGAGRRLLVARDDEEDVMRRYRRIEGLFRQLQTNLSASTWSLANEHLVNTRLEGLNPVKDATYDSTLASTISRRSCTDGTRTEVLSNLDKWVDDLTMPTMYWMNGMAGTGKTTIAYSFAGALEKRKLLAASFFCTRTVADCRNPARIIPSIAYQLARYSAPFQTSLCEVLGDDPDLRAKNIQKQFERLIRDPLDKAKEAMPKNLVVVIDALDECEDRVGVEAVLDMLFRYGTEVPLKFYLTSRPEPEIYKRMSANAQSRAAFHLHDIEKSLVQADIELYLKEELSFMSPTPVQIQQLAQRSGSLFIYAATLVRYIRSGQRFANPCQRLQSVLDLTPESTKKHAEIDALYTAILASALEEARMEQKEAEDVKLVLRTVLFAQEPTSVETIAVLAGLNDPERVSFALQPLRSVLHQSETTGLVSTLHASFPDFMSSHERAKDYFCDIVEHSQQLAKRCFEVMKERLRFNICDLESSSVPDKEVENVSARIKAKISPALGYACRYWGSHLALAPRSDALLKMLEEFLCDRLLFWIEVLSLRRELLIGIETLLKAKHWLNQAESSSSELVALIEDARSFVTGFASSPASQSTPHIYISFLPFCPRSSMVYKNYWKRTRGLLELKGSLRQRREGAALATWNIGSKVYSVAYSPDGTQVVVGCYDHTVRMLNAHDGTALLNPLEGHTSIVCAVAFSPDGKLVASGSTDCTIRVWNAYNGTLVTGPLEGHTRTVYSIAFSFDSMRIVSGSADNTLRIWNTEDGTLLQGPLEDHSGEVNSVAFSPDGTLIASGSDDDTVRLWNPLDGTSAASPFQGHTTLVMSVVFTSDGTRLVSGSYDKTIRVWNVSDGSLVGSLFEGHTGEVYSMAISPDGTRVVSGSNDCTVRVWNIDDGTLVAGPFVGHTSSIHSVAYSPDGTRVVSGSEDGTIRIWNVREELLLPSTPFRDHLSNLKSFFLFGNGARIFSGSSDASVWAWDISLHGITPSLLQGCSASLAKYSHFPSSASHVVLHAKDHSIEVLDASSGSLAAGPLLGHTGSLASSMFSTDLNQLVTGSEDCTVRVWDLQTSQPIGGPFRGHAGSVISVAILPDCLHIVSCSEDDHTIRIWSTPNPTLSVAPPPNPSQSSNDSHTEILDGLDLQDDGWVTNSSSNLIFWIPNDLRQNNAWPSPHVEFIITKDGILHVPRQELLFGDQWSRCYIPD